MNNITRTVVTKLWYIKCNVFFLQYTKICRQWLFFAKRVQPNKAFSLMIEESFANHYFLLIPNEWIAPGKVFKQIIQSAALIVHHILRVNKGARLTNTNIIQVSARGGICPIFYVSKIPIFFNFTREKRVNRDNSPNIGNGGCFSHLFWTNWQFLCNYLLK